MTPGTQAAAAAGSLPTVHPAWLPAEAFRELATRRVDVHGDGLVVDTIRLELAQARAQFAAPGASGGTSPAVVITLLGSPEAAVAPDPRLGPASQLGSASQLASDAYRLTRTDDDVTHLEASTPAGLLHGFFHLVRLGARAFGPDLPAGVHRPAFALRMLDHWDNVDVHPVMGQVERGYSGGSLFWDDGRLRTENLGRVRSYARLLAATGINAVSLNNVNVHATETRLLTDPVRLAEVALLAEQFRPYGIRVHLSVNFAAPVVLGDLPTADPLDVRVRSWWAEAARRVYATVPDFGGFVVKADSEGQPGPFGYGRSHADGANMLAAALAPFGGTVHWRAFVYNHHQDWRDRTTDRARAAYDHFAPLDGEFAPNVLLQVKHGPIDFQPREPVSPVLAAMPRTRLALELQATQEYTGQQRHVCYLAPMWREVLAFRPAGPDAPSIAEQVAGEAGEAREDGSGSLVAVSNAGDDPFWTGHPLAQANLYAFGRLAWSPQADPQALLDEWIDLTFPAADPALRSCLHAVMDDSWHTYESYTAPLGVGFMVRPGDHYGPDVDGYEYTPWGTYHFADRDGVGVDRTQATGTGFAGQYPEAWALRYESPATCPDELLLFFHHVPYEHVLHSGKTVIQHIYDTHAEGAESVAEMVRRWDHLPEDAGPDPQLRTRVRERLAEQLRSAEEWRDQVTSYFFRKSGIPDAQGRPLY